MMVSNIKLAHQAYNLTEVLMVEDEEHRGWFYVVVDGKRTRSFLTDRAKAEKEYERECKKADAA